MSKPLVSIRDLCVTLGGNKVLDGVDLDLPRGSISALIGLNGSGKTTLLRALVKEVPYSGRINFHCGHDHTHAAPEHVGYVPQKLEIEAGLPLTVADLFALSLQRSPLWLGIRSDTRKQTEELLDRVGANAWIDLPVAGLSGGQRQRILLALALQPQPELLLLDEPAAGIDFRHVESFYSLIETLNKETGVTVLLVSHDLSIVGSLAHTVICLADGSIQCQGTPKDILAGENLAKTFGHGMAIYAHHH